MRPNCKKNCQYYYLKKYANYINTKRYMRIDGYITKWYNVAFIHFKIKTYLLA